MSFDVLQVIGTIAAALTGLGVIGVTIRMIYKFAKRLESAIGTDSEGRSLSERLVRVEHQVFPNGGGSLSDQVESVHRTLIALDAKTDMIESMLLAQNANANSNNTKRPGRSPRETASAPTATNKDKP
jgi:glucose-6-phosphate-specific signal transduction histidine kinase